MEGGFREGGWGGGVRGVWGGGVGLGGEAGRRAIYREGTMGRERGERGALGGRGVGGLSRNPSVFVVVHRDPLRSKLGRLLGGGV